MDILRKLRALANIPRIILASEPRHEQSMLAHGRQLCRQNWNLKSVDSLADAEFSIFSQWGDDGIIQWLIRHIKFPNHTFVEFGVEDYRESNTRFLMMNNNWSGFVMDGSRANVDRIIKSEYYWKYDLKALSAFITAENVNDLILKSGFESDVGILHIDLDGNDYWIWKAIKVISPIIAIVEYNSVFGADRAITVPYDPSFNRTKAHFSNLYFGSSLSALNMLSQDKGYAFIGCNSSGNNAYFIRRDFLRHPIQEVGLKDGFVESKFRESRSKRGSLTYSSNKMRIDEIKGMPAWNVSTSKIECI